jgi:putative phage-type endonuclease
MHDLDELEEIIDTLVFEDEPSIFTEEYALEFIETTFHLLDEYMNEHPNVITEPDFQEVLFDEIQEIVYIQFEEHINNCDIIEDDLEELLEIVFDIYITSFHPERSISDSCVETFSQTEENINILEAKIQKLRELPQPVQRTAEWYQFRWNLITASNAYKAFGTQASINQLIYEKCQPLKTMNDDVEVKMVNTNTPLHWGQKYEPLTVLIYEHEYKTKVEDFGCIQHPVYKFLGASPDGIIVGNVSDRYGRMLEIKNVVSRDITGIPKKEYWVQMQLQMEVCDLDECDFLETKFIEYPDSQAYKDDLNEDSINFQNTCLSNEGKQKGIIIYFHTKEGNPFYVYKPIDLIHSTQIEEWEENTVSLYQSQEYKYSFLKFIYWKLDVFSCVLVLRNREWFKNSIPQIEKTWKIIEEERITGYTHRAPNKKVKKDTIYPSVNKETNGCLLINKIIKEPIYSSVNKEATGCLLINKLTKITPEI